MDQPSDNDSHKLPVVSPTRPNRPTSIEPSLRFPTPQGSLSVAHWVASSSDDNMLPLPPSLSSDESDGADSSWDLLTEASTDNEDQETDQMSLAATEEESTPVTGHIPMFAGQSSVPSDYMNESNDDEEQDLHHTLRTVHNRTEHHSPSASISESADFTPSASTCLPRTPIDFEEAKDFPAFGGIAVKHTLRALTQYEIDEVDKKSNLKSTTHDVFATLRQTVSQRCLSIDEPLRVLYAGDVTNKGIIMDKISLAITCSAADDETTIDSIFFASRPKTATRRVTELRQSPRCSISVEQCVSASKRLVSGGMLGHNAEYSVIVKKGTITKDYVLSCGLLRTKSLPAWRLPDIVVVYCASTDPDYRQMSRATLGEIARRHGLPCIVISDKFDPSLGSAESLRDCLSRDSPHVALELQSSTVQIPQQRIPVPVDTFLRIDNRQMNKNLAYLTGLQQSRPGAEPWIAWMPPNLRHRTSKLANSGIDLISTATTSASTQWTARLQPLAILLHRHLAWVLYLSLILVISPMINGWLGATLVPRDSTPLVTSIVTLPAVTSITTSVSTVTVSSISTSTTTITAKEMTSTLRFGGLLGDNPQTESSAKPAQATTFAMTKYGMNEVLITMPKDTKSALLGKSAILLTVSRGAEIIKNRQSLVDEGIVITMREEDAHGMLNITLVTTRRPRINETVTVDFGGPSMLSTLKSLRLFMLDSTGKLYTMAERCQEFLYGNIAPVVADLSHKLRNDSIALGRDSMSKFGGWQNHTSQAADALLSDALRSWAALDLAGYGRLVQDSIQQHFHHVDALVDRANFVLLRARIGARLTLLRAQGKTTEADVYEARARVFLGEEFAKLEAVQAQYLQTACKPERFEGKETDAQASMRGSTSRPHQKGKSGFLWL